MFTLIQAADFQKNDKLLTATFKLRKKVFADQLNWDVPVTDDQEFDAYDINIFPLLKERDFQRGQPSFQLSLQRRTNALPRRP